MLAFLLRSIFLELNTASVKSNKKVSKKSRQSRLSNWKIHPKYCQKRKQVNSTKMTSKCQNRGCKDNQLQFELKH